MYIADTTLVLDRQQLSGIALDDEGLMRELLDTLLEDTGRHLALMDAAIRDRDPQHCRRLAHYAKGACANVGANAAAAVLLRMESEAVAGRFEDCAASLSSLAVELERLRAEVATL